MIVGSMTIVKGVAAGAFGALAVGIWLTVLPGLFGVGSFMFLWGGLAAPVAGVIVGLAARGTDDRVVASWMLKSAVALAVGVAALMVMLALA